MIAGRTLLIFALLVLFLRLLGKRQVGQLEPSEFAVALLIAELAAIPVEEPDRPLLQAAAPLVLVFAAERIISSLTFRSTRLRRLICGKPVILIENGTLLLSNLRRTRVSSDELRAQLREKGFLELQQVQFAILETNGTLSVFPCPGDAPAPARAAGIAVADQELPYSVLSDGQLLRENLALAGKTPGWVDAFLRSRNTVPAEVVLLTVTKRGQTSLLLRSDCR